jgi:hypothetical protein
MALSRRQRAAVEYAAKAALASRSAAPPTRADASSGAKAPRCLRQSPAQRREQPNRRTMALFAPAASRRSENQQLCRGALARRAGGSQVPHHRGFALGSAAPPRPLPASCDARGHR